MPGTQLASIFTGTVEELDTRLGGRTNVSSAGSSISWPSGSWLRLRAPTRTHTAAWSSCRPCARVELPT